MSAISYEQFSIDQQSPDFTVSYDPCEVLPPDAATVGMAFMAANIVRLAKIAQKLYEPASPASPSVIDLGSGSGVIGATLAAASPDCKNLVSVDADERTLPHARRNIEHASRRRAERGLGSMSCSFVHDSWSSKGFWEAQAPADLVICNPPYLLPEEQIRAGYERTPAEHLYAPDMTALVKSYEDIIRNAVAQMRPWSITVVRLPNATDGETWWPLAYGTVMEGADVRGDEAYYVLGTWRYNAPTDRPLHALTIEKLPLDYPAVNPVGDVRVDYFQRYGRDPGVLAQAPARAPNQALLIADRF